MLKTILVKRILLSALVPLNTFLIFFLAFESRLVVPPWLQVFGRIHPLLLHFPIGLFTVVMVLSFIAARSRWKQPDFVNLFEYLLLISALTAVLTALMGFFLYTSGDYASDAINWHKWSGIGISLILCICCFFRTTLYERPVYARAFTLITFGLIIIAGHFGSVLTHGDNFVLDPLTSDMEVKKPSFNEAVIYADLVKPILKDKCMSCHSSHKAKGQLVMETKDLLLKGGRGGRLWDTASSDFGLLMRRIHLPLDQKKHMPPTGKPQLTEQEMFILESWVKGGADFEKKLTDLDTNDSLYLVAKNIFSLSEEEVFGFDAADNNVIAKLNNSNRIIVPIAEGSSALRVNFFNKSAFSDGAIKELEPLKQNITEINFVNMPVTDKMLALLKSFKELRKLNLSSTGITGSGLKELAQLPMLKTISLSSTPVTKDHLQTLALFPALSRVYLWNSAIAKKDITSLEKINSRTVFDIGFTSDTSLLQLPPPLLFADNDMFTESLPVRIAHYIKAANIKYTTDGSEPDSLLSAQYKGNLTLHNNTMVKAKAFGKGWLSSETSRQYYFKKTFSIDSIFMPKIPGSRGNPRLLIDGEKSDINFTSGRWLSFGKESMDCFLFFDKPAKAKNLTLSFLLDISALIMPPGKVEVWGGSNIHSLKLLSAITPDQPMKMQYREILPVECNFRESAVNVIRLRVTPLKKIPDWHQQKGSPGNLFVDEVFVN